MVFKSAAKIKLLGDQIPDPLTKRFAPGSNWRLCLKPSYYGFTIITSGQYNSSSFIYKSTPRLTVN